jgi:hypothetical protein
MVDLREDAEQKCTLILAKVAMMKDDLDRLATVVRATQERLGNGHPASRLPLPPWSDLSGGMGSIVGSCAQLDTLIALAYQAELELGGE